MTAYIGPEQKTRRLDALCLQKAVMNDHALAEAIEAAGEPKCFAEDELLMEQGQDEDDVYFILSGFVDLEVKGHPYLRREAREMVGEMAGLEPGSRRSATARAGLGGVVAIKLRCNDFIEIGRTHSALWRNVARELSSRLRQRNAYFIPPNLIPEVFIASSGLGKNVLQILQNHLSSPAIKILPWTDDTIFKPSEVPMESLEEQAKSVDFAIIVTTADDYVTKNFLMPWKKSSFAARDNVLLEFGFFAGALDRRRVFVVAEDNPKLALPTDLGGLTTLRFKSDSEVRERAQQIEKRISALGPLRRIRSRL